MPPVIVKLQQNLCVIPLKDSDSRLKSLSFIHNVCNSCDLGIREDVVHIVIQCPANEESGF